MGRIGTNYCPIDATSAYILSTPQESTGETPNMVMLGREVCLPVKLTIPTIPVEEEAVGNFAESLRTNFQEAHREAERATGKSAKKVLEAIEADHINWRFNFKEH